MANHSDLDAVSSNTKHLVTLRCGQLLVAINLADVQEINRQNSFCEVPEASRYVRGVMNLRGEVITMIDLRAALQQETNAETRTHNIFVRSREEVIGLVTDGVSDIVQIPDSKILPPPTNVKGVDQSSFRGVYTGDNDELVLILDLEQVLSRISDSAQLHKVAETVE